MPALLGASVPSSLSQSDGHFRPLLTHAAPASSPVLPGASFLPRDLTQGPASHPVLTAPVSGPPPSVCQDLDVLKSTECGRTGLFWCFSRCQTGVEGFWTERPEGQRPAHRVIFGAHESRELLLAI